MYLMLDDIEVDELLKLLKTTDYDKNNYLESVKTKLTNAIEIQKDVLGETYVRWIIDDVMNEWEDRYETKPSRETAETFIESYLDGLDDVGGESAIQCGWDVIYNAFDDYEKDMEEK